MVATPVNWGNLSQPAATGPMPPAYEPTLRSVETAFNVNSFLARGDGVTDDTAAIQKAINACAAAGGGVVYFPAGVYLISSTLTINADNVQIEGAGWAAQIMPAAGWTNGAYLIFVQQPTGGTGFRYGFVMRDIRLACASVNGVNGVRLQSTYYALLDHVRITNCAGNGVFFDGTSSQFGAYTTLRACAITNGVGATSNAVYTLNYHEFVTLENCNFSWYNTAGAFGVNIGDTDNYRIENCVFDECDTAIGMNFVTNSRVTGCTFDRAVTTFISLTGTQECTVEGNIFQDYVGVAASPAMITIAGNSSNRRNLIRRNKASSKTIAHWGTGAFASEGTAGGGAVGNIYESNDTEGLPITLNSAAVPVSTVRNNVGVNPVGHLAAQPAVPASATAYTNASGVDCTVYIAGGTVTAIAVGGTATGATAGTFRVAAGQTIALTYSVSPTWSWFGE